MKKCLNNYALDFILFSRKNEISSIINIYQVPNEKIYINENYNENRLHYIEELESDTNFYNQKSEPNEIKQHENFEFGAYFSSKKSSFFFFLNNKIILLEVNII